MPDANWQLRDRRRATASPTAPSAAMSRAELADTVNTWLAQHGKRPGALSESYVATLEQGRVRWPGADYRAGFRAVLGTDTDAELGFTPTNRPPVAQLRTEPPPSDQPTPVEASEHLPGHRSGSPEVIAIRAMCASFQTADRQVGDGALYATVIRYLTAEVAPKLLDPTAHRGGALFAAACSVTEMAGWMAHDGGQDDRARSHFSVAYRLASAAEQDALAGNVCASMSHLAGQLNASADAVRIAEVGLRRVKRASGAIALRSRLHAMRARGLAMRGDSRACLRALTTAEHMLSQVDEEPTADWIAGFDAASLAGETALCLRQLGDLAEAQRQAQQVIELRSGDRVRSRAFGQLTLAGVLADAGRPDEAAVIGIELCERLPTLHSARVRSRLDNLAKTLQHNESVPEVAEFLACLAAHASTPREGTAWPV